MAEETALANPWASAIRVWVQKPKSLNPENRLLILKLLLYLA